MKYFKGINNLDELRKEYKNLIRKNHPDCGGDLKVCQEINVEYEQIFEKLKNENCANSFNKSNNNKDSEDTYKWDVTQDKAIRNMIFKFVHFEGINIEIIGSWIWIDGQTYEIKELLSENKFLWSRKRKMWHWSPYEKSKFYKKGNLTLDEIRNMYGSQKVDTEKQNKLA